MLQKQKLFYFLIILIVNLIIFLPSFSQIARHDHLHYIANRTGEESWFSLAVKNSLTQNKNHYAFAESDPLLFRPLFYFVLGTELSLFEYNFFLWQITGFLMHMLVAWALLSLLFRIKPSPLAGMLTLLFTVMYGNVEMVIWHNISSYMIYVSCVLACLYIFYDIAETHKITARSVWFLFFFSFISCFLYEVGFLTSFLLFTISYLIAVTPQEKKSFSAKHWRLIMLSPGLCYLFINLFIFFSRTQGLEEAKYIAHASSFQILKAIAISFSWWFSTGLFPWLLKPALGERVIFYYNGAFLNPKSILFFDSPAATSGLLFLIGAIMCYLIILKKGLTKRFITQRFPFLLLVLGAWALHMVVIVIGRKIWADQPTLANNSYYAYFFWFYLIVASYSLINFKNNDYRHKLLNPKTFLFIFCFLLVFINASKILTLNQRYQKIFQKRLLVLNKVRELVKAHRDEKGFTFAVDESAVTDMPFLEKDPPVPEEQPYAYAQMIYPMFFEKKNPRYMISLPPEQIQEANISSLEARIENFIEPPALRWEQSDLKSFILLINAYIEKGEKEKALKLVDNTIKFHADNQQLLQFVQTIKEKIARVKE